MHSPPSRNDPGLPSSPGIKAFHTLAWASIESCVLYVLYAGL